MRLQPGPPTVAALAVLLLAGCALPPPNYMEVLVETAPPGAACTLGRAGQPLATAAPTPAIALLDPTPAPIDVRCRRAGYADAALTFVPRPAARTFGPPFLAAEKPAYEQRVDIALLPR
ncbi:MAG: hypothetical protein ACM3JG_03755 [Thiohalocapsa sp.]